MAVGMLLEDSQYKLLSFGQLPLQLQSYAKLLYALFCDSWLFWTSSCVMYIMFRQVKDETSYRLLVTIGLSEDYIFDGKPKQRIYQFA